jgi:ADP-heptose:LPS heptosyltransferase
LQFCKQKNILSVVVDLSFFSKNNNEVEDLLNLNPSIITIISCSGKTENFSVDQLKKLFERKEFKQKKHIFLIGNPDEKKNLQTFRRPNLFHHNQS